VEYRLAVGLSGMEYPDGLYHHGIPDKRYPNFDGVTPNLTQRAQSRKGTFATLRSLRKLLCSVFAFRRANYQPPAFTLNLPFEGIAPALDFRFRNAKSFGVVRLNRKRFFHGHGSPPITIKDG
jgi:hypothetical protein